MPKRSFRNPVTNVLTGFGYMETNQPGDIARVEAEDFALEPGHWQWDGSKWIPFQPPPPPYLGVQGVRTTQVTIQGLNTQGVVALPVALPDAQYIVLGVVSDVTGAPAVGASVIRGVQKRTDGFTLILVAPPGPGASVTFDCVILKVG